MNKHWVDLIFGQVQIKVTGRRVEQFINRCLEHEIAVSDIRRMDETSVSCLVGAEDIRKLRPLLRQSDCKLHILKRKGLPFFVMGLSFKKGFVGGMILFAAILFVLSNMLWNVQITGADPATKHEIRQVLDDMGITPGKFQFSLPAKDEIQYAIKNEVQNVAWVGANLNGTTYKFQVLEKEIPKKEKALSPRNLVATKEAVIYDIYVEQGQAVVHPDEYVHKGDVLISGTIGNEKHQKNVPAKGKVLGETWYDSEATVPLVTELKTYTGKSYTKRAISLFGFKIPIWGFSKPNFKKFDVKTKATPLKFLKWKLPFSFVTKTYKESQMTKRTYTKKEAIQAAKQLTKKDLLSKLDKKDRILSEKALRETVGNGKVKVLMHYTVIENIATEQPLIESKETE